jgi:hypothetical protein
MTAQGTTFADGGFFHEGRVWLSLPAIAFATGLPHLGDVTASVAAKGEYKYAACVRNETVYVNFFLIPSLCLEVNQVFPEGREAARQRVTVLQLTVLEQISSYTAPERVQ